MADTGVCAARSKPVNPAEPGSHFICTNDQGHQQPAHTACDGHGHVLARWASETSPIETWVPYAGFTRRVVTP
jgi:hypothetical protein